MKSKGRLFALAVFIVACFLFILWPNSSFQNFLFYDILQRSHNSDSKTLEHKCSKYFEALRTVSLSRATTSRYLLSHQISNHIAHLRVYCLCYIQNGFDVPNTVVYGELQPMFSGDLPSSTKRHPLASGADRKKAYWHNYLKSLSGRGIVIGIHDKDVDYAVRLLKVLRFLENELPIQFVHEGDLSDRSVKALDKAASQGLGVRQNVEFMLVRPAITHGYQSIFKGYNNKWFAALFTTFLEMILMDADAVPFVKPSSFFELEGYKKTGAYFFRDRELSETLKQDQVDFYTGMIPPDNADFGFAVDLEKRNNNFFNYNSKHVMESGVVVMDRRTHMLGLLVSLSLQYWFQSGRIMYGDKDLFWLGQLISGNSNYHFNEYAAAAVGTLEDDKRICSAQLGHLSKEKKLLWTNGTLLKCKKNTWLADFFKYAGLRRRHGGSVASLRLLYLSAIEISEAIIPAPISQLNGETKGKVKSNFNKNYNRGCAGIYYCATNDDGGEIIRFTPEEQKLYGEIVAVWNS